MSALGGILGVGGLGVIFAGSGTFGLLKARRLRGRGVTTEAVVVGRQGTFSPGGGGASGQWAQQPVLMFTTREGRQVRVTSPVGGSHSTLFPGHTVTVHYDPADPEKVSVPENEAGTYRLFAAIGVLILVLLAAYGVLGQRLIDNGVLATPLFLGAVFTGVGWFGISRTWPIKHGGTADGVVVGTIPTESGNGFRLHNPVIRYVVSNGVTYEVPTAQGRMGPPPPLGTRTRVRYDRARPERMMLPGQSAPPVFWIFGIAGIPVMIIGIIVIVNALR